MLISISSSGPFPLAYMAEKIGRKKTILWMAAPTLISWILIVVATSIYQVLVARFLIGLSGSVVFSIVPRYVAEIAEASRTYCEIQICIKFFQDFFLFFL